MAVALVPQDSIADEGGVSFGDPFEEAFDHASVYHDKWLRNRAFLILPATQLVGKFLATFKEFPAPAAGQLHHRRSDVEVVGE